MTSVQSTAPAPAPARHCRAVTPLRIAMLGTRGASAVVETVGQRLVRQGHEVTAYALAGDGQRPPREHLGMRCITLSSIRTRSLETVSHATLAALHLTARRRHDVAFLMGVDGAALIPLIQARGTAVAVHLDGRGGRRSPGFAERAALRKADALIVDTLGAQQYYEDEFAVQTELLPAGATILTNEPSDAIEALGLVPGHYHLAVARFEADDRVEVLVEGYHRSGATMPLVLVGAAQSAAAATERVRRIVERDARIRLLGDVRDPRLLDQLHAHALGFVHGGSRGGTTPSLLRAMGAGTAVVCWDAAPNREIAGTAGSYFDSAAQLASRVEEVERYPFRFRDLGELMQERARSRFDWNAATERYEALAAKLARGFSTRGMCSGHRVVAPVTPVWATRG